MTATPIPRTLSLTAYGDLDATVLRELPSGRRPVETHVVDGARALRAVKCSMNHDPASHATSVPSSSMSPTGIEMS